MAWLTERELEVTLVTTFAEAKARLADHPSLLISEVRLGEYNGLHLVLHAQAHHIPAIVIGRNDPVLERDAEQLAASYLTYELQRADLFHVLESLPPSDEGDRPQAYSPVTNTAFLSWADLDPHPTPAPVLIPTGSRGLIHS